MGTWGTGINSNDTAADVINTCREVYSFLSPEDANKKIMEVFSEILSYDQDDDELANFWYALANWQWEHGVLTEKNKLTVLNMLKTNRGMDLWLEEGNKSDIKKRKEVLNKLYLKLISPMPLTALPKAILKKPKHKIGDIIIFQTVDLNIDKENFAWHIDSISKSKYFKNSKYNSVEKNSVEFDAHKKYLAIICVGIETEPYSKYSIDLLHSHSIYAFYDYCEKEKPTIEKLKKCEFLPATYSKFCPNQKGFVHKLFLSEIDWTYTFTTIDPFSLNRSQVQNFEKLNSINEKERFDKLIAQKGYSNHSIGIFTLNESFQSFFREKLRFSMFDILIDNLLDGKSRNPELLSPQEYNDMIL